jgi:hypothetical protein
VLARFARALDHYPAETVVRLTADCPLSDPEIIVAAIDHHAKTSADYVSNTLVRTWPDGLDVEVMRSAVLLQANAEAKDAVEREHVTPFIYRRPERFHLEALTGEQDLGDERWTVDTASDLEQLRWIVEQLDDPAGAGWRDILSVTGRRHVRAGTLRLRPDIEARPGNRQWFAEIDGTVVGTVDVRVDCGVGRVRYNMPPRYGQEALRALQNVLHADYQVTELIGNDSLGDQVPR